MDNLRSFKDIIKDTHFSFFERMGWKHLPNCICRQWETKPKSPEEILKEAEELGERSDEINVEQLSF